MHLIDKLSEDLNSALKDRDETKVSTLRFLISNINNAKIAKGSELVDDEVMAEISKETKRHKESIDAYSGAKRTDLVEKEEAELKIINSYLPEPYSEDQLKNMVEEAIAAVDAKTIADMGRVVKAVMSSNSGRADGAKVAELVRVRLSANS